MSQQLMQQQWTYQFRPGASAEESPGASSSARATSPSARAVAPPSLRRKSNLHISPSIAAIIAVVLIASLLAYVSANAYAARTEYERQRLQGEIASLRARNAALRCQINQTQDLVRVHHYGRAMGMRPADPAAESDFISLAPAHTVIRTQSRDWFSQGPCLVSAFVRQLSDSYSSGRAEASPSLQPFSPKELH